ncbi:rhomboid family intramembrane serine protease [Bacillus sp. FSL K6-3431]|uniref:rhomboid family intramembrane serine protease n=1 Tax=Bacillus sp. FSL K6-3431 TaxID=2921500 RepID=UPI0030FABD61
MSERREDYFFWRLAHYFSNEAEYRLLRVNENQTELWFENKRKKNARLIRLVRFDLNWANKIKRDIQILSVQSEKLRKHFFAKKLTVLNLYISPFFPVDDYEYLLENKEANTDKINIETIIMSRDNSKEAIDSVSELLEETLDFHINAVYDETEINVLKQTVFKKASQELQEERQLFEYSKPFFAYAFMAIQIIVFILLEVNGGSTNTETLVKFGAKYNPLILEGEWWRFITPVFLHIGILHLAMNTLALYYLGTAVEKMFGHIRFIWIYVFSGFTGTLASFVFTGNLSAGASGAIFGCFGALLYLGVVHPKVFFRTMGMNVLVLIGINLVFGFSIPGIDNAGHIGGLVGGFLATGVVHFPRKHRLFQQAGFLLLTAAIVSTMIYFGYHDDRPEVVNSLASNQMEKGEMEEAYELLSDYVGEGKGNAVSYFQLSLLEIYQEQYGEAQRHLQQAIKLNPDFHEAHFNLALLYSEAGELDQAKEHVQKAQSLYENEKYEKLLNEIEKY